MGRLSAGLLHSLMYNYRGCSIPLFFIFLDFPCGGLEWNTMSLYFDHNATTPVAPEVVDAMVPFLGVEYGNASSIHHFGQRAKAAVERARAQLAALIH